MIKQTRQYRYAISKDNREIDLKKTLLYSLWIYLLVGFFFMNAILYSLGFLKSSTEVQAICFWAIISIILVNEFCKSLVSITFIKYTEKEQ